MDPTNQPTGVGGAGNPTNQVGVAVGALFADPQIYYQPPMLVGTPNVRGHSGGDMRFKPLLAENFTDWIGNNRKHYLDRVIVGLS